MDGAGFLGGRIVIFDLIAVLFCALSVLVLALCALAPFFLDRCD